MPPRKPQISPGQKLVNNLTVADARHIVNCEGGELTAGEIAIEVTTSVIVAAALARAIWVGDATVDGSIDIAVAALSDDQVSLGTARLDPSE